MWDANKFGKDDPKVGENHGWLNRTLMKWYDKQTTDTLVYTYYGYNIPGDDQYVKEEDLEPTTDKFNIYTVWEDKNGVESPEPWGQCCDVHINNSCKDIHTGLPSNGITGADLMKEGTMIEIDYEPSKGGAPHLVFFDYRLGADNGGWVDIYPTDMDEKAGRAYFAYPTLLNTWEGLNGTRDYSSISDIFIAAAFTNVTAYSMKICLPKAGANIPDPFVDPYETFNFWNKHTVYGPEEGDDSSEVIELPSSSEEESSIESSSEEESSSEIDSSSEEDSSSNTEIVDDTWTGNENITNDSPLVLDVNLGDWEDLTIKINFTTGQYYGGLQIDGANSSNLNNKTSYLPWTTVTGQTSYEYEFKASQLTSDINKLIICGDQINVTKVEFVGTKKGGSVHTHKYTSTVTKAATCTEDGVRTYTCSCGDSYTEVIKATGHKFGAWTTTTAATCTKNGVQTRTCSVCGEKETRTIAATGHKYVETIVAPTTTEQGYTLHKCSVCGDEYKDNFTDPVKDPTTLSGKVASQYNTSGDLRFIAMIKSADAAGADVAYYDLKVDGKLVERVPVTKTYKSYGYNGKTQQAPAGANFIITKNLSNLKNGQKATFELYFSNFDYPLTRTITVNK